jgi:predicted ABC-type ATPase
VLRTVSNALSHGAEPTRTLPDGSIMPNPELGGDRAEFDQAIDGSLGTKEAKEKARGLWDKYHDNYLTNVRPSLETMPKIPGVENYIAWRERMQKEGAFNHLSENQKAERYMEEQKKRSGFVQFIDNLGSNLLAGSHDLVAGIAGTAGLLTGSKAASEFAAEKAEQAERTTAALQHTGNDGLVNNVIGGGARAVPGMVAAAATGGTVGAAAMGFTQGAGTTYADLYKYQREMGLSHEAASQAATGAAMASGAVSAALGKVFSGGAQALNNPAAREAAKKSFGAVLKSFVKGAADEIPQEVLDGGFNHVVSEMSKGKTVKEATASYLEQLPENMLTAGAMGGGVHAGADLRGSRPEQKLPPPRTPPLSLEQSRRLLDNVAKMPTKAKQHPQVQADVAQAKQVLGEEAAKQAPAPPPAAADTARTKIPENTTTASDDGSAGSSGQQRPATDNHGQPSSTSGPGPGRPRVTPPQLPLDPDVALDRIHNILDRPPEQRGHWRTQQDLAQAQQVMEDRVRDLERPGRDLTNEEWQQLHEAHGALDRLAAEGATHSSGADLPPGDSSTTDGVTPPAGNNHGTSTGTGEGDGNTSTGSSGDTTSPRGGTHSTNGVKAPSVGHGNLIPENTTHPEHLDLARRRAENLEKIAGKRKLNLHEQEVYDNARRILDRTNPGQPGDRNTGNPQDLVMAGGDGPNSHAQGAAADAPPPAAPAQPANAIGSTIQGPGMADTDSPRASANDGSGDSALPFAQQQPVPQGGSPTNGGANSNGQPPLAPPASTQAPGSSALPHGGPAPVDSHRLASPPEHVDPRLKEAFKNWPHGWDEQGFPHLPRTLPDDHDLVSKPTVDKKTVRLPADHPLVAAGVLPAGQDIPRKVMHDAIMSHLIRQATPLPADASPTVYALGGGGGAGKSSLFKKLMAQGLADESHVVRVDADEIKKYIPEYNEMRAKGDGRAASMVQLESARIADSLLKRLMGRDAPKYHVAYDSTMSKAESNLRRIADWRAAGRRVHLIGVTIDPKEAAVRAAIRASGNGRWVPSDILAEAHQGFNEALQRYLPEVDAADIFDNSGTEPRLVAKK